MHPLDGAYKRIDRAREHLTDLNSRVGALAQTEKKKVIIYRQPFQGAFDGSGKPLPAYMANIIAPKIAVPETIKILVGETIYNLRAALDYLVYELARLDSGMVQDHTQFPIEDSVDGFKRHKSYLKGINLAHRASIENLQPYKGCQWIKELRDLSNPDKHRELLVVSTDVISAFEEEDSTMRITPKDDMDMDFHFSFSITFSNRMPVKNRLQKLISLVTETLNAFYPEFK